MCQLILRNTFTTESAQQNAQLRHQWGKTLCRLYTSCFKYTDCSCIKCKQYNNFHLPLGNFYIRLICFGIKK